MGEIYKLVPNYLWITFHFSKNYENIILKICFNKVVGVKLSNNPLYVLSFKSYLIVTKGLLAIDY